MPPLMPGDPAPWFTAATSSRPDYSFPTVAGRYIAIGFVSSSTSAPGRALIAEVVARRALFDDLKLAFFGVTADPADQAKGRVVDEIPGLRWFYDPSKDVARRFGALDPKGAVLPWWMVLDPMLRVVATGPISEVAKLGEILMRLPPVAAHAGVELTAPVLVMPRVFEPGLCARLVELHRTRGGELSGFMVEQDGKTTIATDPAHKLRADYLIEDPEIIDACRLRILRRLAPEVAKAFQFVATRMERYLVACYDAAQGGWFRPHRDNTTRGTAHRRFAVTINLNAEDYEGGELRFPEFGPRTYKPPTGGAVVFSCSLLHEATPVTRGARFAFLPFLYDEAAARLREQNNPHVDEAVGVYQAS